MTNYITEHAGKRVHGGFDYAELAALGFQPEEVMDFSINSNPYGPSSSVRAALADIVIDRYPDRDSLPLRQAILRYEAREEGLSLASIVCGNGAAELIWVAARAFLNPGSTAAIIGPTFGEYHTASLATGARVIEWRAEATEQFQPDLASLLAWLRREQADLLWLCNPNNPTGIWLDRPQLAAIARTCQELGTILVVDESYRHFVHPAEAFNALQLATDPDAPQLLVLRSLTKDFALAALRLGYAAGAVELIKRLNEHLPSWNVSSAAQTAGCAALADREHLAATLQTLGEERDALFADLADCGLRLVPSRTHYILAEVGDARHVRQQLLQRKLLVRDCTSFGLPGHIRIATRPRHEWRQLVSALQEIL